MTTDPTPRIASLFPSPTMKLQMKEWRFGYMNIYSPLKHRLFQGLNKTILRNMKLLIKTIPKDWVRLTILQAESIHLLLILQGKTQT